MVLPSERVETDLRARLAAGEWDHGDQLPTVRELAAHYGVSGRTVSKVLTRLAADGLIVVRASWGAFRA
jgi:DNA-binding GntR family transcriptional regulator